ncbi:uncharacterized protein LOC141501386 isoform X2 [Macrotis lagotis]
MHRRRGGDWGRPRFPSEDSFCWGLEAPNEQVFQRRLPGSLAHAWQPWDRLHAVLEQVGLAATGRRTGMREEDLTYRWGFRHQGRHTRGNGPGKPGWDSLPTVHIQASKKPPRDIRMLGPEARRPGQSRECARRAGPKSRSQTYLLQDSVQSVPRLPRMSKRAGKPPLEDLLKVGRGPPPA